jgi:hypothetical protein
MPLDPDDLPSWLRKLRVTAAQIDPGDYSATLADGISCKSVGFLMHNSPRQKPSSNR